MPCSSHLRARFSFATVAGAVTAAIGVAGSLSAFAAPPNATAPAPSSAPTMATDADVAAFYLPFGEKINRLADADNLFNTGVTALNVNDYRTGGAALTLALATRSKFSSANLDRGICSEGLQKWDFAVVDFTKVIAARPKLYDAYVERARSYKMMGDLAKAHADIAAAEAIHPERPDAYTILGDPDPKLGLEADAVAVTGFSLQPPKGYTKRAVPMSGDIGDSVAWIGPARSDGSRPYIAILVMTPPAITGKTWTTEGVLTTFLLRVRQSRSGWSQAQMGTVTINGIPFAHATWTGTEPTRGVAMRGFGYVAQDGERFVYVSSQDVEPYAQDALALANASARTLRKP